MIIQKGASVWYWPTPQSPAPLSAMLGASIPAVISRVAKTGAGNAFSAVFGTTLDLAVSAPGVRSSLRGVPFVSGRPTAEQLASGFCTARPYVPPPTPVTFEAAVAAVRGGKTASRSGARLTPADVAAADWMVS